MHKRKFIEDSLRESSETKLKMISECMSDIEQAVNMVVSAFKNGNKLLLCGNGGSAADSQHIAAEFVIRLSHNVIRPSLPAIAITTDTSNLTAGANDIGFENVYARTIEGLGSRGDILIALSTSGNSPNILKAADKALEKEMKVIGFIGGNGGKLKQLVDIGIIIPSGSTQRIQEGHITAAHILCELVERDLFG